MQTFQVFRNFILCILIFQIRLTTKRFRQNSFFPRYSQPQIPDILKLYINCLFLAAKLQTENNCIAIFSNILLDIFGRAVLLVQDVENYCFFSFAVAHIETSIFVNKKSLLSKVSDTVNNSNISAK